MSFPGSIISPAAATPTPPFTGGIVPDPTEFQSTLQVDGDATLEGALTVVGAITADSITVAHNFVGAVGSGLFIPSIEGNHGGLTIAGASGTAPNGDGSDVALQGGTPAGTGLSGAIMLGSPQKITPKTYVGAGPFTMDPTKPLHQAQANFAPTVLTLPPLDGSVNVGNRLFWFVATNTAGGGKALRLTAPAGDTIAGAAGFFAIPTGNGFTYAQFWADIANRNWVQLA